MSMPARLTALCLVVLAAGCGSGGGGGGAPPPPRQTLSSPSYTGASLDPSSVASVCPGGTLTCGAGSGACCPTGTLCAADSLHTLGCGSGLLLSRVHRRDDLRRGVLRHGNDLHPRASGGAGSCGSSLCCGTIADEVCPVDVASQCAAGTRCLKNHSALACTGGWACYLPTGGVACPGEVICPSGADFCPAGTACFGVNGVCAVSSHGANAYCCKAAADSNESCDDVPCKDGLSCLRNPNCPDSPQATKVCKGTCGGGRPVDCGTYCCASDFPGCDAPDSCWCWAF